MDYDSFEELEDAIDDGFRAEISMRTIDQWKEDLITHQLVSQLRVRLDGRVRGRVPTFLRAQAYKAAGKVETDFGDLAIIIRIEHHDGSHLEGVAFLEAKRVSWAGTSLESLRKGQLERHHKNLWNGRLLMYDKTPITGHALDAAPPADADWPSHRFVRFTHAAVVPLGIVLSTGLRDTSLYKFALPFAHQVAWRVATSSASTWSTTLTRSRARREPKRAGVLPPRCLPSLLASADPRPRRTPCSDSTETSSGR